MPTRTSRFLAITFCATMAWSVPVLGTTDADAARPSSDVRAEKVSLRIDSMHAAALAAPPAEEDGNDAHVHDSGGTGEQYDAMVAASDPMASGDAVMVGAMWSSDAAVEMRTRDENGWTEWVRLHRDREEHLPDSDSAEFDETNLDASEPVWTGPTEQVQFRASDEVDLRTTMVDISGGDGLAWHPDAPRNGAADASVRIRTRADWGADESRRDGRVSYSSSGTVRFSVVHHIGGSTRWTWEEIRNGCARADDMIRAIYNYHTSSSGNNWWDIGYNFVVDPCGTVWEARAGGVDKAVNGAHAGGFNDGSVGVLALGTFSGSNPDVITNAMKTGIQRLLAYKFDIDDVDPGGRSRETSGGGDSARWSSGTTVYLPTLSAHQISNYTSCPGWALMQELFDGSGSSGSPKSEYISAVRKHMKGMGWDSVTYGDFDGDGRDEMLVYDRSTGQTKVMDVGVAGKPLDVLSSYRLATGWDEIIAGDYNGDGRDELSFYRSSSGVFATYKTTSRGVLDQRTYRANFLTGWTGIFSGDHNGDGRDQLTFYRSDDGRYASYRVGSNSRLVKRTYRANLLKGWSSVFSGDFNNNGRDQVTFYRSGDGRFASYVTHPDGSLSQRTYRAHLVSNWTAVESSDQARSDGDLVTFYRTSDGRISSYATRAEGQLAWRTNRGNLF